jgi:diguanylate cyclase (GGDEF)-like protein
MADEPVEWEDRRVRVTLSLGVAAWDGTADGGTSLLREADEALYDAKRSGRDRVVTAGTLP